MPIKLSNDNIVKERLTKNLIKNKIKAPDDNVGQRMAANKRITQITELMTTKITEMLTTGLATKIIKGLSTTIKVGKQQRSTKDWQQRYIVQQILQKGWQQRLQRAVNDDKSGTTTKIKAGLATKVTNTCSKF